MKEIKIDKNLFLKREDNLEIIRKIFFKFLCDSKVIFTFHYKTSSKLGYDFTIRSGCRNITLKLLFLESCYQAPYSGGLDKCFHDLAMSADSLVAVDYYVPISLNKSLSKCYIWTLIHGSKSFEIDEYIREWGKK